VGFVVIPSLAVKGFVAVTFPFPNTFCSHFSSLMMPSVISARLPRRHP